jgi:hypothetical protein
MEHTMSIHDSGGPSHAAAPEPFELPAKYDASYERSESYDAPVPLHAYSDSVEVEDGWVQEEPALDEPDIPAGPIEGNHGDDGASRRIVLRMKNDETVQIGSAHDQEEAMAFAKAAVKKIATAEAAGEWPEFDGRFVRTDGLVSVDIQVAF